MGTATHLGPWLLGTNKDTTGTTAATTKNTGATIVSQSATFAFNASAGTVLAALPAGAMITDISLFQTTNATSGTSGTVTVLLNGTAIAVSAAITTGTAGILPLTPTTPTQTAAWNNIGATDGLLTYTPATLTAGAGSLVVGYVVRNSNGTIAQS